MGIDDNLEVDYRRKCSLKFRLKQRKQRAKLFGDAFHKQDRSVKSLNKVLAAKRRKRDDRGKFNLEARKEIIFIAFDESQPTTQIAAAFVDDEKEAASAAQNILAIEGSCNKDQETWHGEEPEHGQHLSLSASAAKSPLHCSSAEKMVVIGADDILNSESSMPLQNNLEAEEE